MAIASNLGFPRIGAQRELKKVLESYWKKTVDGSVLQKEVANIRKSHWQLQRDAGIAHIPSNDFSYYDHVLDTIALVGAVPQRYGWQGGMVELDTIFAMARGVQEAGSGVDLPAMEMTKWFDTNYHYIVPEFEEGQQFTLASEKPFAEFEEALALGIKTRPVLLGPFSFLQLGKCRNRDYDLLSLLPSLVAVYQQALARLHASGAEWVQIDEPCLVMQQPPEALARLQEAYQALAAAQGMPKIMVATYYGALGENLENLLALPVQAVHLDLVRAPAQLAPALQGLAADKLLSLGVVDGRNIWKNNFARSLELIQQAVDSVGSERLLIAPSCSLIHTPVDLAGESALDAEIKNWMAFAKQKLDEIAVLTQAVNDGREAVAELLRENEQAHAARAASAKIHSSEVKARLAALTAADAKRQSPYEQRYEKQRGWLNLPMFPTTTIGSFPQTSEIRVARRDFKQGKINSEEYRARMQEEICRVVREQEDIGLDVLVHGEPERNDMVEYFGEQLQGFCFTQNGWVQSYGSRCVKPPVIFGDVSRPQPMTVDWISYAKAQTKKQMKGMLTGPVTILQWSFVRDDQPRCDTARQIALAIRDEVVDLEAAGIAIIQIDEPALREGLPLARAEWQPYLQWAIEAFGLASCGVADETQIHTHMCYSEFNDIIESIGRMDADVITIESSRSDMELLEVFRRYRYPNEIGPGIYDIHSPRIPSQEEMLARLEKMCQVLTPQQLWVNPDCGLKTRGWEETIPSLKHMVAAAQTMREELAQSST